MNQKYKNLVIIKDNILKQREFTVLNKAFNSAKIPMVPIKGVALLFELPDYGETRSMADIDILVKKEDVFKSKAILLTLGYKIPDNDYSESYYLNQYHHLPFYNNNYMVELHWNLCPPRPNNIILPELWQKIRHLESYENTINLLSPEDTIFSLTLHLRRFNDPFSLRYVKDIQKIVEANSSKIDWDYILKYSRLNRLESLLYYSLICIKIKLGYSISTKIIDMFYPGAVKASLIKLFIAKSNWNNAEKNRKCIYVFLRLLLYNSMWDFIKFIILLPEEEFSRFYSIKFPSRKSSITYSLRFLAMPFLSLFDRVSKKSSI